MKKYFNDDQIVGVLKDYIKRVPTSQIESSHGVGRSRLYSWAKKIGIWRSRNHDWEFIKTEVFK